MFSALKKSNDVQKNDVSDCDPLEVIDILAKAVWMDYLGINANLVWTDKLVRNGVGDEDTFLSSLAVK